MSEINDRYNPPKFSDKTSKPSKPCFDHGPKPFILDIKQAVLNNNNFRTTLWTGSYMQLTVMCIPPGEEIGLEMHACHDQFIAIEQGCGLVKMGNCPEKLNFQKEVSTDYAFIIPAGTWHNLINTGKCPLKLYSIYAPPEHPHGTVHKNQPDSAH